MTIPDETSYRMDFEAFKSTICHQLKDKGDLGFLIDVLESDNICHYYNLNWYPEAFYLLAMTDYICNHNKIPLCNKYDHIRRQKLAEMIYPRDIILADKLMPEAGIKEKCIKESIPEFLQFNIIESEIRNVI